MCEAPKMNVSIMYYEYVLQKLSKSTVTLVLQSILWKRRLTQNGVQWWADSKNVSQSSTYKTINFLLSLLVGIENSTLPRTEEACKWFFLSVPEKIPSLEWHITTDKDPLYHNS